ncbi:uncharacterized protein LOC121898082 [Scomber scombrus]|uniref:Uncharacterized protein LOC121898082 n=1 Tax=Scomber scombrus TaxID=13677 RepID=A0AAV1PDK5_SCOSC
MVAGFQIISILLICFLSEVNYSSAFPRARSSMYPEAWQGVRKTSQEEYAHWIRRPLQYIQALRQTQRKLLPNVHSQDQVITTRPGLYHETQSPYLTRPDVANELIQKLSPPQRNHLPPKPRSFEFSLEVPFAKSPDQNKEHSSIIRVGGYSTNNPDSRKNTHVSKPSFQLSFSVPIPSRTPPTKHTSSNLGYFENLQKPGSVSVVQTNNMEPAISTPSQYESTPSVHYYGSQLKPGGNYEQGQTGQSTDSQFTIASEQYKYGHFKPSFGYGQNEETVSHPGSPTIPSLQYELPSVGYPNRKAVTTTNYDGKDNMLLTGQMFFSSSSPYEYDAQSGQALLPDHPTAFDNFPNFQHLSTERITHVTHPGQSAGGFQQDGKTSYTKLLIDMEDKTDADEQNNYFAAPVAYYDPYSVGWMGQNTAAPLSKEPQSHVMSHQSTGFEYEQKGTERHDTSFETHPSTKPEWYMPGYDQTPLKDGVGEQHAYNPQKLNAVFVPTNFDQERMLESTSQSVPNTLGPSYGQYPIGQMKPTSDQSVVTQNPAAVNRIDYSNTQVSIISQNPSSSTSSDQVKQHGKPWESQAQTKHAPAMQLVRMDTLSVGPEQYYN